MAANRIYIYIDKQRQPAILNVDNDTDGAVLEQLGAVKMPENLVAEIFGEQAEFADSTNCTITPNPDNPAFPYSVTFDANKIPAAPKRNISTLSGLAMPNNDKYISLRLSPDIGTTYSTEFTVPANGWIFVGARSYISNATVCRVGIHNFPNWQDSTYVPTLGQSTLSPPGGQLLMSMLPVHKGDVLYIYAINCAKFESRFYYAEGEI